MKVDQHYALIVAIIMLFAGFFFGINANNNDIIECKNAIVEEKIITTEQIEEGLSKEVTYYKVRCVGTSSVEFRIQTDRDYPLNSNIKKTWVKDGK